MKRYIAIAFLTCSIAATCGAAVKVSLERPPKRDDSLLPYRPARMTIDCSDAAPGRVVTSVRLRSARGGPILLYDVTVAAGTSGRFDVMLPALSAQEHYEVRIAGRYGDREGLVLDTHVSLTWDAEEVTVDAFLDPRAYKDGDYSPPRWSAGTARGVFVTGVVAALAMAAALFFRSPGRRAGVLLAVLVGASAAMAYVATREPVVVRRLSDDGRLLVISTRRTTDIRIDGPGWAPLYRNEDHMSAEALVVRPGKDISGRLRPDDVRLFRKVR